MVSKLSINVSYNNQHHVIECTKSDFLKIVAEKFKIDDRNIELYSMNNGQQRRILHHEVTDLMKVIIEDKRKKNGQQRTIDSCTQPKRFEDIISKLKNNSILTGQERKDMVVLIQSYSSILSNKRKIDDVTPEPKKSNKKVQVNFSVTESATQTDEITLSTSLQDKGIIEDEIGDKMKKLSSNSDASRKEISKLMSDSYDNRRVFIKLKAPPVSVLIEKYPFLFELDEVKNELGRIFHSEKPKQFIDNMFKYAPLITHQCISEDIKLRTKKSMERCHSKQQKKYAEVVGSVFMMTDLMKENWSFIHLQDYPSGSDDIYPHIDASCQNFKELFFDGSLYDIMVEGHRLCIANNFLEAILCLVAAFFIFNIDYPPRCRNTMIMFEKLYLKANDTMDLDDHTMQMLKLLELQAENLRGRNKN